MQVDPAIFFMLMLATSVVRVLGGALVGSVWTRKLLARPDGDSRLRRPETHDEDLAARMDELERAIEERFADITLMLNEAAEARTSGGGEQSERG